MKTYTTSAPFSVTGFSLSHIIFDNSHYATLWATCRIHGELSPATLLISFDKLNNILRFSGELGEKIQLLMVDEMMSSAKPPFVVNISEIFGEMAVFTSCKLTLCNLLPNNEEIKTTNAPTLLVEDISPINLLQQAKNLAQHHKDFCTTKPTEVKICNCSRLDLYQMYAYYIGLLELDINETAAREKALLTDNRLFVMAKNAHKSL